MQDASFIKKLNSNNFISIIAKTIASLIKEKKYAYFTGMLK